MKFLFIYRLYVSVSVLTYVFIQLAHLPDEVKHMNADNALKYRFCDQSGRYEIASEAFQNMLLQSGASLLSATKEYVLLIFLKFYLHIIVVLLSHFERKSFFHSDYVSCKLVQLLPKLQQ